MGEIKKKDGRRKEWNKNQDKKEKGKIVKQEEANREWNELKRKKKKIRDKEMIYTFLPF